MGFSSIGLLQGSNKFVTQLSFGAIFTNIFVSFQLMTKWPRNTIPNGTNRVRERAHFKFLPLPLSNSNSDFSAEEPPETIKMCRCRASEDDLPLSLEVRRALIAFIRQVEEQIAQLQEPRDGGARAVLGGMEDDQGSEDDSDSEDDQDSEDDFSLSEEFWFFFIIMFLFWSAFFLVVRS